MNQNELKALVGQAAVKFIEDGMIVGLGTGSTVRYMVDALGKRVQEEGLNVIGVTTSNRTTAQAQSLGITIKDIDEVDHIDLCIDGADEIDTDFNGIKGGAGAPCSGKRSSTTLRPSGFGSSTNPSWSNGSGTSACRSKSFRLGPNTSLTTLPSKVTTRSGG